MKLLLLLIILLMGCRTQRAAEDRARRIYREAEETSKELMAEEIPEESE